MSDRFDRFLFTMRAEERAVVLLRVLSGLTALYSATLLVGVLVFPSAVLAPRAILLEYIVFNAGVSVLSAVLALRRSSPPWLPALAATLAVVFTLAVLHAIGTLSSTTIVLVPTLVAIAVPFFGHRAGVVSASLLAGFVILSLLEAALVLPYSPLRPTLNEAPVLSWGHVFLSVLWVLVACGLVHLFSSRLYRQLEVEQAKSEALLANTLPAKVIAELKAKGVTEPEQFPDVTVYFSDIVGFTDASAKLAPVRLIAELSEIFSRFDEIMAAHGCERIKTIGDAYLGVAGMDGAPEHALRMVTASREIVRYLNDRNAAASQRWLIRIGIHSGPIVGGIVGRQRYLYDVFGDTINTASRMESNSEPMRINVSAATATRIGDRTQLEDRGELPVKGKGTLRMFFA